MSNETHQQQISIGPQFFSNEKRAYESWTTALVREVLQNGTDAPNSRNINFIVHGGLISIQDDGNGMTRDVLINVFMNLGESTKKTADTCGGFGIARNLICFAQESYEIRSHDYLVRGSGSGYTITDMPIIRGCCFTIQTEIDDEGFWLEEIRNVLSRSNIKQNVYLNGISFHNTNHRGRYIRSMNSGEVYVNKSDKTNYVHVRSNGVWMFSKYMHMGATVYVEVTPEISKKVFTSNRDGMQSEYRNELDAFLRELASETLSALKPKNRKYIQYGNKGDLFTVEPKVTKFITTPRGPDMSQAIAAFMENAPKMNFNSISHETGEEVPMESTGDPLIKTSVLVNESNDATIARISLKYAPDAIEPWTTRYKLLKAWKTICDAAVREYVNWTLNPISYGIGWLFTDDHTNKAQCFTSEDRKYLLLNPIDRSGKIAYGLNDKEDLAMLIAIACHEVTHLGGMHYHDESFASTMTTLTGKVIAKMNLIFRELKD